MDKNITGSQRDVAPAVDILGLRVHNVNMEDSLAIIEAFSRSGIPHHITTVNPEFVMLSHRDANFKHVVNSSALATPDGEGILWAARMLGHPMKERVTGVDSVRKYSSLASRKNLKVFFLGAAPGIAEQVALRLREEHPGLAVAGTYAGSPDPKEEEDICRMIRAAAPHILFVAYGTPAQEFWISRNLIKLGVPVTIGVGGSFDFIAGKSKRAPQWIQNARAEWLYRLFQEPRRWRRMLALPKFAAAVVQQKIHS